MSTTDLRHARLTIEYDGEPYHGWARQPGLPSVEQDLYDAFAARGIAVEGLVCAGRTDRGVHARGQVVSLAYRGPIEPDRLRHAVNGVLPDAVSIRASEACAADFDARSDALSRAYEYRVLCARAASPLRRRQVLHHPRQLDLDLLQQAAAATRGRHDFTAFTPSDTDHVFFHRTVLESRWEARAADELVYCIRANAFLRHMVRVLVGSMLSVGRGDWPLERFTTLLQGARRHDAHHTAPAHPLCLVDVEYPSNHDSRSAPTPAD